ncbi:MAG TPA: AAA family ATPase [Steroidobacteraceae bacterium]|jgi:general secretion pathway protein A
MYLAFFGLNEKPFAITPDPRYLFLSERHAEALAHLMYGITEAGGFIQLTGEVGTGKTTVIRSLLAQTPQNAEIALILNPRMTAPEFLLTICEELGIGVQDSATSSLKDLVDILSRYLLRAHGNGKRVVLIVDEAQNLAPEVLEQVRLLTNLETNTQKLLQIILIGQPELRELLDRNELRQLAQRITGRYHLCPLSVEETAAYVRHRLRVAGAISDIFTPQALRELHRLAHGVPRLINVLGDRALLGAYTQDRHQVGAAFVRRGAMEVFGRQLWPWWLPWSVGAITVVVVACGLWASWRYGSWGQIATPVQSHVHATAAHPVVATRVTTPASSGANLAAAGAASEPAAAAASGPSSAPASPLGSLLAHHAAETTPDAAFAQLFSLWGAQYKVGTADPCTQASAQGLECYVQRGTVAQLRLYNRPAILMLTDDADAAHQIVLRGLDDEHAQVDIGGHTQQVSVGDLSRYWFGDFILLWRPGTRDPKPLSQGMRGADVLQLRQQLTRLAGGTAPTHASDVYDGELSQLVRDFQRAHRLNADGVAGVQTLVVLNSALAKPDSPQLAVLPEHGS